MTTLRFRVTEPNVPVASLSKLRQLTSLSISEIRSRAAIGNPIFEITPFESDWQDVRHKLVKVYRDIASGSLPLAVSEQFGNQEVPISLEIFHNIINHFRQIELETQRDTMLELGEISDPSQFEPYDEDWTR